MNQCKTCGYSGNDPEIFRKQKNIWGRVHTYCQVCADSISSHTFKLKLFLSFCAIMAVVLYFLYSFFGSIWLPVSLALIPVFTTIAVTFHETGHALTARLLGLKVHFVILGSGKPWLKFKLGGVEIELRGQPFSGFTAPAFIHMKGIKHQRFLTTAAGPFMNLFIAILPFCFAIREEVVWLSWYNPYLPLQMFILMNFFAFITAMWPRTLNTPLGKTYTDGKSLLMLPTMSQSDIELLITVNFSMEAKKFREDGNFEEAERVVREGLDKFPDNPANLNDLALIYMDTGRYHETLTILHALMKREGIDPGLINLFANNIAWTNLLIGDPELLEETDHLSDQAYKSHPRVPSVMSTRGWVLIAQGQVEDGISLLQTGYERTDDPKNKAEVACCLAMGEAKLGHMERAKLYLHLANMMDSSCELLKDLTRLAPELEGVS